MLAEFRHLDGAQSGQVRVIRQDFATIGRHPSADLRFESERDVDVSGRHAAVFRQGDAWMLRDLGSASGTWVNGARLRADHRLVEEDVIQLGQRGPRLAFRSVAAESAAVPVERTEPAARAESATQAPRPARPRPLREGKTTTRARRAAPRRTTLTRWLAGAALVLVVVALAAAGWSALQRHRAIGARRAGLLARSDSLLARLDAATTGAAALRTALDQARREGRDLRATIAASGTTARLDSLGRELTARAIHGQEVISAAALDAGIVALADSGALVVIVSELADGRVVAGSGFAIRRDGDIGWLVTCRHLVTDSAGRAALRLGAIFNGTGQTFRAVQAYAADSADLVLLAVRVRGGVPVLRGPATPPAEGTAVAVIGYPEGLGLPGGGDWRRDGVRAIRFPATVRSAGPARLELDGYGARVSSGSPVLNAAGELVGVVFGGEAGTAGRRLHAVPAGAVAALLTRIGK